MAASDSVQSVDDVLMCLMGMGFELEDCQQAVQAGKISVEAAVEWLLAGKPAPVSPAADAGHGRLTLTSPRDNTRIGANPFSNPQPIAPPPTSPLPAPTPTGLDRQEAEGEESKVVSRMHMSDEQRHVKERFEEKERLKAQQQIKMEKEAQKKARAEALKQIQEDRDRIRVKRTSGPSGGQTVGTGAKGQAAGQSSASAAVSPTKKDSLLQIRLPDGRALKQTFPPESALQVVWQFVESKYKQCAGMCLMQPFPRQEFGSQHMASSLKDLGLVPTGSLVLKKMEGPQGEEPTQREPGDGHDDGTGGGGAGGGSGGGGGGGSGSGDPSMEDEPPAYNWGSGNVLHPDEGGMDTEAPIGIPPDHNLLPAGEEEEDMNSADSDDDMAPPGGHPGWGGGGGGGGGGGFPGGFPGFGGHHGHGHQWGDGHSMMEIVLNQDTLPHKDKDPRQLAAEAARQRYDQNPPQMAAAAAADGGAGPSYHSSQGVTPLVQMVINHVSGRICETRKPITGLQGLPADVAFKVLDHLIKERLLRPKTLQPFISCHLNRLILDCYPYATNELLVAIRNHVYLTHLSLASCPLITDKGMQPLIALKRMRVLSLAGCRQITNNCIAVIKEMKNLVTLVLEDTGVSDPGVIEYAQTAPRNLQHLDISRTEVTHRVMSALQAIPNLKVLNLEQTKVGDLSGVENLACLEALNVAGTPIVTSSLLLVARCQHINMLNIANTPEVDGNTALAHIAGLKLQALQFPSRLTTTDQGMQFIAGMPLHTLDLTNYIHVGDTAAESIGSIHSLRKLRLGNTKITDTGMVFLGGLRNLTELLLDRTAVTDTGASIVQGFTSLQELSLSETSISDVFLKGRSLSFCIMLSKLNLSRTSITDKGIMRLSLPHLTLLNIDSTRVRPSTAQALPHCPRLQKVTYQTLCTPPTSDEEDMS